METEWIQDAFSDEIESADLDVSGEYKDLRLSIENKNYRREALVVQDAGTVETIGGDLGSRVDEITLIRTNRVTK
ncbi:hypothetical protein C475_08616 [Halosimplex carlsbadense 2-9-1]|uniref:Uncharacterized protein n=1 Tax=Halosimplex carlsbadense 2-9-1 TaxID=797114 RepID=M0CYM3_9EURY|nr:hypothetical protein [Halosimplex carlsbadense]ELZ26984.1 hypothetical protein C475_08616 [Halosimplex carlsbadense 2-9-1]